MSDKQRNYTAAGFKALQDELDHIRHVDMERNKKDIAQARSFGDLSENSEYDEAKNEQAKLAARAFELEELIKNAHVVDDSEIDIHFSCCRGKLCCSSTGSTVFPIS